MLADQYRRCGRTWPRGGGGFHVCILALTHRGRCVDAGHTDMDGLAQEPNATLRRYLDWAPEGESA